MPKVVRVTTSSWESKSELRTAEVGMARSTAAVKKLIKTAKVTMHRKVCFYICEGLLAYLDIL